MLVNMTGGKKVTVIENVEPVLLWTNENPTAAFEPQRMIINGAGYDGYLVECRNGYAGYPTMTDKKKVSFLPFFGDPDAVQGFSENTEVLPSGGGYYSGRWCCFWRTVYAANENKIYFGTTVLGGNQTTTGYEQNAVPTRIWGVKFTL